MRVLALDIGERRVGVAMSDPAATVASPLAVLDADQVATTDVIPALVEEHDVGLIVVGLPLTMRGEEGPQAVRVREIAEELAARVAVPLVFHDERLSSAEARRAMRSGGMTSKRARGTIDKVAAAIFLQSYLDGEAISGTEREIGADGTSE